MKALSKVAVALFCLTGTLATAQKKINCAEAYAAFEAKISSGDYAAAYEPLAELRAKCASYNENIFRYGEDILTYRMEIAKTPELKSKEAKELVLLYTEHAAKFPQSDANIKKALLMKQESLGTADEVYKLLDAAFAQYKNSFTDYNALEAYFLLYLDNYTAGNKGITQEQLIEKYSEVVGQVHSASDILTVQKDQLIQKQEAAPLTNSEKLSLTRVSNTIESLSAVNDNIDILAGKYFSCDKLAAYYEKNFEANKANVLWLDGMVNALYDNKCTKTEVLFQGAKALHGLKPSSQTAYYLGSVLQRRNQVKEARGYYEEAVNLEHDASKKADLNFRIANLFRNSDKAVAKEYALRAIQLNPQMGRPYLFLAEMYFTASQECSLSDFDKKALTWLAIDNLKKAEAAEAKYKPTVVSLMETYSKKLPSAKEISKAGKRKGDKISYGCWINETVTIPNTK